MEAALDEHTAACDALKAELGGDEVGDVFEELGGHLGMVAGLQAKAKMLLCWYWYGSDTDEEDPVAVEIIKGLASAQL